MKKILQILTLTILIQTVYAQTGNVGIGTASPDASAALDITDANRGLLIPRLSLTDATIFGLTTPTVAANTAGMIVFNTNTSTANGLFGSGFYYWTSSTGPWTRISNGKLPATLTDGKIWVGSSGNNPVEQTMSGDVTISNAGVTAIGTGKVTTTQILDGTIATADIANNAIDGTKINIASNATGDLMYYNGTDWIRLASGTTGNILQTTNGGAPSWVNPNTFSSWTKATTASTPAVKADNQYVTGNVGIGDFSVSSPIQTLDVNGRVNVTNGVIQRGGTAITGTTDLGLYSRVSGNWIRYVTNAGPHVWFTDDNTGTTQRMQLDATGGLSLPTTLNGTGNRIVYADANGKLKTNGKNIAFAEDRVQRTFSSTAGGGSGSVTLVTSGVLAVEIGDIIHISTSLSFAFTGGSGNDDMYPLINITGCTNTSIIMQSNYENFDNDRNEYQPMSNEWIYTATCTGNLQFVFLINAEAFADDGYKTQDAVIVVNRY